MPTIKDHDVTLYGGNDIDLILRPLTDEHLPLLRKWRADTDMPGEPDVAGAPPGGHCFLIEADGVPIGNCRLLRINLPEVTATYPEGMDVRCIDMMIGEKPYQGRGIGAQLGRMMVDFAFCGEFVDVLHCVCGDSDVRGRRIWEKCGFAAVKEAPLSPPGATVLHHYALVRAEFVEGRREKIDETKRFDAAIADLQPSQLCVSAGKLRLVREWFNPSDRSALDPIPVKRFEGKLLMTDGHTRAVAAYLAGWETVPAYWDEYPLDMRAYAMDVSWCGEEGIASPIDLARRIVSHKDYEELWRRRCLEMVLPDEE